MEDVQKEVKGAKAQIIIVQTAKPAFDAIAASLEKAGFVYGTEYVLASDVESAEEGIIPNEIQLLITGTLHGDEKEARNFVEKMKKINPKLIAAIFSAVEIAGEPFNFCIKKTQIDDINQLSSEMKKFLGK
jgi:hypothetical protein